MQIYLRLISVKGQIYIFNICTSISPRYAVSYNLVATHKYKVFCDTSHYTNFIGFDFIIRSNVIYLRASQIHYIQHTVYICWIFSSFLIYENIMAWKYITPANILWIKNFLLVILKSIISKLTFEPTARSKH